MWTHNTVRKLQVGGPSTLVEKYIKWTFNTVRKLQKGGPTTLVENCRQVDFQCYKKIACKWTRLHCTAQKRLSLEIRRDTCYQNSFCNPSPTPFSQYLQLEDIACSTAQGFSTLKLYSVHDKAFGNRCRQRILNIIYKKNLCLSLMGLQAYGIENLKLHL